jgi:predicted RecB family nuclease
MKLFEISATYRSILESFEDAEGPEQVDALTEELSAIEDALESKAEAMCQFIKTLEAEADAFKAEEERLRTRRQALENGAERIKRRLEETLMSLDISDLTAGTFKLKIQQNNPSVRVDDEALIPSGYYIPVDPKLDKKGILEALKAGDEVPGCAMQRTRSIRIR